MSSPLYVAPIWWKPDASSEVVIATLTYSPLASYPIVPVIRFTGVPRSLAAALVDELDRAGLRLASR